MKLTDLWGKSKKEKEEAEKAAKEIEEAAKGVAESFDESDQLALYKELHAKYGDKETPKDVTKDDNKPQDNNNSNHDAVMSYLQRIEKQVKEQGDKFNLNDPNKPEQMRDPLTPSNEIIQEASHMGIWDSKGPMRTTGFTPEQHFQALMRMGQEQNHDAVNQYMKDFGHEAFPALDNLK